MPSDDLRYLIKARAAAKDGSGRALRLNAALSVPDVAHNIDASTAAVWRWERGERRPSGPAAVRWGRLLARLERMQKVAS
jgi:DNA-binding transcriptional regulator YiaG